METGHGKYVLKCGPFDFSVGHPYPGGGGGTLGISGWGCAAGTLEPLTYTRATTPDKTVETIPCIF